jgi:sortase A
MRRIALTALNITGFVLLIAAAVLAWNVYQANNPTPPSDATVIVAGTAVAGPPALSTPGDTQLPLLLPESKAADPGAPVLLPEPPLGQAQTTTAFPEPTATETATSDPPGAAEKKSDFGSLTSNRKRAFPPAAQTVPTRIVLPALKIDSRVIPVGWTTYQQNGQWVSEWAVADYAVGFHRTSALPGAAGNTIMAGHNNINGEVFRNLIDLKVGDDIFVYADQNTYHYVVRQKMLLQEAGMPLEQRLQNAQWIAPTDDDRLTLVSCWPVTSNTHRVVIVARPAA